MQARIPELNETTKNKLKTRWKARAMTLNMFSTIRKKNTKNLIHHQTPKTIRSLRTPYSFSFPRSRQIPNFGHNNVLVAFSEQFELGWREKLTKEKL